MEDLELFSLLHLADSALPVGSFAFSFGLESMAKHGQLGSVQDFSDHLSCVLSQSCAFEVPILQSMFNPQQFAAALNFYHVCTRVPHLRKASEIQGRAWLRLLRRTHPCLPFDKIDVIFKDSGRPSYFLAVFSQVMLALGHSIDRALQLFLYCGLRDQVSAAIRLGLVGPGLGHAILSQQLQTIPSLLGPARGKIFSDAVRTLAVLDVAQLAHSQLYSKQYQN